MQERIKALDRCGQFVGIGDACLLQTLRADIIGLGILKFAVGIVLAIFLRGRKTAHILIKGSNCQVLLKQRQRIGFRFLFQKLQYLNLRVIHFLFSVSFLLFTPPELAKELVALAGVRKDSRVLEPEAGIGNIADAAKEVTDHVDCIERMTDFCEILKLKKHNVIGNDLLTAETAPIYDAVVMNPPFSEECEHIKRAFDFLRPGGSLVAVCSSSIQWKSTRKYEQFRDWLSEHTHSIDECGAKFEMTGVHTVVLVVDKAA